MVVMVEKRNEVALLKSVRDAVPELILIGFMGIFGRTVVTGRMRVELNLPKDRPCRRSGTEMPPPMLE